MTRFKLGLNIDNIAEVRPLELAPGWEVAEVPITELVLPYDGEEAWRQKRDEIKSWHQPPFTAASHWLKDERITGDDPTPFAELERQAEQHCRRLAELGTGMVAGIWELFRRARRLFKDQDRRSGRRVLRDDQQVCAEARRRDCSRAYRKPEDGVSQVLRWADFCKTAGPLNIRVMADLNYFVAVDEPFEDIAIDPTYCVHVHIQGDTYQPNYGNCTEKILHIFRVLRDVGYQRTVSSAHPWISTVPGPFNYRAESARTLEFLVELRERVFAD